MSYLSKKEISKILDLKSSDLIDASIAERQLEVIRKAFNFLYQDENNAMYIADEVGLGKTYIALGIASLLRHFSKKPETYQDLILVPKENLQIKWEKEIKQFMKNNYKLCDNRVKSVLDHPVAKLNSESHLTAIKNDLPSYHLLRATSFSFPISKEQELDDLYCGFNEQLTLTFTKGILEEALKGGKKRYFKPDDEKGKARIKKLFAYLLAIENPFIELLIVDEGHNYKKGISDLGDHEEHVSDRNNVISRFFGIKQNTEDDKFIFELFPEIKNRIKPCVGKLLVLSATPKTESVLEFKNQFDCFLKEHILKNLSKEDEVISLLPKFLIRGKMEYKIGANIYSRNQCRNEHRRQGNVDSHNPEPLTVKDGEQALIMGLLQYKTIKHLNTHKHNNTFELGMLAGFETFRLDQTKRYAKEQEYEETGRRKENSSQDHDILKTIIESYRKAFSDLPPHPKQDAIVKSVIEAMKKGEKSLIFVRRVSSAYELERKFIDVWEIYVAEFLKKRILPEWRNYEIEQLLNTYDLYESHRQLQENLPRIINGITDRLFSGNYNLDFILVDSPLKNKLISHQKIAEIIHHVYDVSDLKKDTKFMILLEEQVRLNRIKADLVDYIYKHLLNNQGEYEDLLHADYKNEDNSEGVEHEVYFFNTYFFKPALKKFRKSWIYENDWHAINYYLLNKHFEFAYINHKRFIEANDVNNKSIDFETLQNAYRNSIEEKNGFNILSENYIGTNFAKINNNTLITELLTNVFKEQMKSFFEKKRKDIFHDLNSLCLIIKSVIRNGSGLIPLYISYTHGRSDQQKLIDTFIRIISINEGPFSNLKIEISEIILNFDLIASVNFPEGKKEEIEKKLTLQSPVKGMSGERKNKSKIAAQFRMPGFPLTLITTDIFREGEDLHTYCQNIFHYGIAWNCSEMEQRTGRIDRINSLSHRTMKIDQQLNERNQIQVFYPYVQKTLEVNQVNKLFKSLNQFTETFDIIDKIKDESKASTSDQVLEILEATKYTSKSNYEHTRFFDTKGNGKELRYYSTIGKTKIILFEYFNEILLIVNRMGDYNMKPTFRDNGFSIEGDLKIIRDVERMGPFRITIVNGDLPGEFMLNIASFLFKINNTLKRKLEKEINTHKDYFIDSYGDYFTLNMKFDTNEKISDYLSEKIKALIYKTDEIEHLLTKQDHNIFNV